MVIIFFAHNVSSKIADRDHLIKILHMRDYSTSWQCAHNSTSTTLLYHCIIAVQFCYCTEAKIYLTIIIINIKVGVCKSNVFIYIQSWLNMRKYTEKDYLDNYKKESN